MKKILLCLICAALLAGCGNMQRRERKTVNELDISYNPEIAAMGSKAIAVFSYKQEALDEKGVTPAINWTKSNTKRQAYTPSYERTDKLFAFRASGVPGVYYAMLSPGRYSLARYWLPIDYAYFYELGRKIQASFEVNPGEVVYLGEIFTIGSELDGGLHQITTIKDEREKAQKVLDHFQTATGWGIKTSLIELEEFKEKK